MRIVEPKDVSRVRDHGEPRVRNVGNPPAMSRQAVVDVIVVANQDPHTTAVRRNRRCKVIRWRKTATRASWVVFAESLVLLGALTRSSQLEEKLDVPWALLRLVPIARNILISRLLAPWFC